MSATDQDTVQVTFAGVDCTVVKTTYPAGGGTALLLLDKADEYPVTTASINVPGITETIPEDTTILKTYSENEGLFAVLEEAGVVEDTGSTVGTGFVKAPLVRLAREIPDYL